MVMIEIEILQNIITTTGFPIAVTVYLLYERSKGYKELCSVIEQDIQVTKELTILIKERL
jgi:hypothetical protein